MPAAGTLFLVATPIGNLEDITLRAIRVLREADLVAAEDTRRTANLLAHLGISVRTVSFHEHNTRSRLPMLLDRLRAGERVALVTDAGTPGVSDPGVELVQACIKEGIQVDPVPGASAPLAAAVASGFPLAPFTFWGFPPARSKDRTAWLSIVNRCQWTSVFFEAPHRIAATLAAGADIWGDRPIVVARELTKAHQEFLHGTAATVLPRLTTRGEFTVVIGPAPGRPEIPVMVEDAEIASEFGRMAELAAHTRRQALAAVARKFGLSTRDVYAAVERAKKGSE